MEAVILIGVQGAGKSTFFRERLFDTHLRLSLDLLKTRHRERVFLNACLATRLRFAVDNTNARKADRAVYIAAARGAGSRVTGYYFDTELREALRRNAQRPGAAKIPVADVVATWKRLERPSPEEGFDALFVVSRDEDDRWVLHPWPGEVAHA